MVMAKKLCRRLGAVLCVCAVALWLMAGMLVVSAANGSIKLVCEFDGAPLVGLEMEAYRIGERTDNTIELQGNFKDYPVYIPELTSTALQDAAYTLDTYAVIDAVPADGSGTVYSDGTVTFRNLEDGVYLIRGKRLSAGNKIYTQVPMLVEVKNGKDVTAYAKITSRDKPSQSMTMYRVKKVWQYDDEFIELRPTTIDVEIYKDGVLNRTVTLNAANHWTYEWTADTESEWLCKEINIDGYYKVVYRNNETQYLLVNNRYELSFDTTTTPTVTTTTMASTTTTASRPNESITTSTTTTGTGDVEYGSTTTVTGTTTATETGITTTGGSALTTTTTSTGKLPQTGQLWWPVPIMGAGGIILFAVGYRLNRKK